MEYVSLFSGIEAASAAWEPLGWHPKAFAEIAPHSCKVLAHRWPHVPNLGSVLADDFIDRAKAACPYPDILVGGSPCQAFSFGGKRESLGDARGQLTLRYVEIADALDPRFLIWENVDGVLHTKDNAFGCFLAGLVGLSTPLYPGRPGDRWPCAGVVAGPKRVVAWRVLDGQHFGVPQRRRRVFLLAGRRGDQVHPGSVLLEPEVPRRVAQTLVEKGGKTSTLDELDGRHGSLGDLISGAIPTPCFWDGGQVAACLDSSQISKGQMLPEKRRFPVVIVPDGRTDSGFSLRRLTPDECEKCFGFMPGHGAYKAKTPEAPRNFSTGNSIAVPVLAWIGRRLKKSYEDNKRT
jgi:DNA (cytosine-5)-methyltransferase 1